MAIRRSAAIRTQDLIEALASPDAGVRDAAAARLVAIGPRAVAHLVDAFRASEASIPRAAMLRVLDQLGDSRGVALAVNLLDDPSRDPAVAAAALTLLGNALDGDSTRALEALGAIAVAPDRPDLERLGAWHALERVPERILAPLRARLAADEHAAIRRRAATPTAAASTGAPLLEPAVILEAAAAGQAVDPAILVAVLPAGAPVVALSALHRLVERAHAIEEATAERADKGEWLRLRGAVHEALAARGSRVAVYDARDTIAQVAGPLPAGFTDALEQAGDAACLDAIAEALTRTSAITEGPQEHEWRDRLLRAGRAILDRERLTRRHAAVKRLARAYPEATAALLG